MPFDRVGRHALLGTDGRRRPLLELDDGECAFVSFVYLSCTEATGCPLAVASLQRLDRALAQHPGLAGRVRLVTVSFDPQRDRPAQMAALRKHMRPRGIWSFFTAANEQDLRPLLEDFGQDAVPLAARGAADATLFRHVTKVFLIDADLAVRNAYSTGYLDYRILLRDAETLLLAGSDAAAEQR